MIPRVHELFNDTNVKKVRVILETLFCSVITIRAWCLGSSASTTAIWVFRVSYVTSKFRVIWLWRYLCGCAITTKKDISKIHLQLEAALAKAETKELFITRAATMYSIPVSTLHSYVHDIPTKLRAGQQICCLFRIIWSSDNLSRSCSLHSGRRTGRPLGWRNQVQIQAKF